MAAMPPVQPVQPWRPESAAAALDRTVPQHWTPLRAAHMAALVNLLCSRHTGRANGVSAAALADELCMSERMLRCLVSEARERGVAISATPETGYYVAETAAEMQESCKFLRSRAMHSLRMEAQLRHIPLPDLLGQLHLPT